MNDQKKRFLTFYEVVKLRKSVKSFANIYPSFRAKKVIWFTPFYSLPGPPPIHLKLLDKLHPSFWHTLRNTSPASSVLYKKFLNKMKLTTPS